MQTAKKIFLSLFFALSLLSGPQLASASTMWDTAKGGGIETIGSEAYGVSSGEEHDLRLIVARIIKVFLSLLGLVFLILIVVAGYNYMTSQGNSEKMEKSIGQIKSAAIGLVIILAAYSIANFVTDQVFDVINRYD